MKFGGLLTSTTLGGARKAPDHMVSCQYSSKLYWSVHVFLNQCLGPIISDEMSKQKRGCGIPKITLKTKWGYQQRV